VSDRLVSAYFWLLKPPLLRATDDELKNGLGCIFLASLADAPVRLVVPDRQQHGRSRDP
jgi:hypothetical protein